MGSRPARHPSADIRLTRALGQLAANGAKATGWSEPGNASRLAVRAADLVTLRDAADAYRSLSVGKQFRHTQPGERARRLLWTALVDRYQLRPEFVSDHLVGGQPDKQFVRLLRQWVARPEDRKIDASEKSTSVRWPDGKYDWCAIVGATGTGKSVTGRELARRTGREYANLDRIVERRHGQPLAELFARYGSLLTFQLYRDGVATWLTERRAGRQLVVAFGAGSVLLPDMRALVARSRDSIWLSASPATILRRLDADSNHSAHAFGRPEYGPLHRYVQIARTPVYAQAARWVSAEASVLRVVEAMMPVETVSP